MDRLVASPCSLPKWSLGKLLAVYAELGFSKYEVFTSWAEGRCDPARGAQPYLEQARPYGMRFTSLHLPPVTRDNPDSITAAVQAARFAEALGASVVLYKADTRESYIDCAPRFLDEVAGVAVTPVVQNHFGTAVTTLDDLREVMDGIADPRMKVLLEVGHFAVAGVHWSAACDLYGDRIALVHLKDIAAGKPVPFGKGEVDFPGLFARLNAHGYQGDFVVEIEVLVDDWSRLRMMAEACDYLATHGLHDCPSSAGQPSP